MPRDPRAVKVLAVSHPKGCRSYLIVDPATREACVVDPLLDRIGEILRLLGEENARLRWIVDTHSHGDHLSGAAALRERTEASVVMHPASPCSVATVRPGDGERLELGESTLVVHHAPGNTSDAIVLEAPGALFTGDTLLIGTVGLQDGPGADAAAWYETLHRIFDGRPDETVIHPGHDDMGRTKSSLKQERTGNGWLRLEDLEAFRDRFHADDRRLREDADALLAANREGLTRVPRDLDAASGLTDPAHATEAALSREPRWAGAGPAAPPPAEGAAQGIFLLAGALVVLATLLGWLLEMPFLHAISGLVGIALLGLGLARPRTPRRRGGPGPGLYYEGPQRKTIGS